MPKRGGADLCVLTTTCAEKALKICKIGPFSTTVFENKQNQDLTLARFWCKIYYNLNTFMFNMLIGGFFAMKKKLISLMLLAGLILSSMTACGATEEEDPNALDAVDTRTTTITLTAITGDSTTPAAIKAVQDAMNKLTKSEYKTQVILQLQTEDDYVEFIESQVEKIEAEIAAEEERAVEIEELKKYVQTKKCVEDVARAQLGLVYENEVLFKAVE